MTPTTTMTADPIVRYHVRRPGNVAWSEHTSERAAKKECERANRTCCPGHRVYATHASGKTTGPY